MANGNKDKLSRVSGKSSWLLTTLFAVATGCVLASSAQAQVIFTDTFASGTGDWYRSAGDSVTSRGTLTNASGELSWTIASNELKRQTVGRTFTPQTLVNNGDKLRLTFDWRQTGASVNVIRVGLFDIAATGSIASNGWLWNGGPTTAGTTAGTIVDFKGYYTYLRDNSASNSLAAYQSGTNAWQAGPLLDSPTEQITTELASTSVGTWDLANDGSITYDVLYEVERLSATQVRTLMTISESGVTRLSLLSNIHSGANALMTFDSAMIRHGPSSGSSFGTMLLDDIQLRYVPVPEPASLAMLGLVGIGLMNRRRRAHLR